MHEIQNKKKTHTKYSVEFTLNLTKWFSFTINMQLWYFLILHTTEFNKMNKTQNLAKTKNQQKQNR